MIISAIKDITATNEPEQIVQKYSTLIMSELN